MQVDDLDNDGNSGIEANGVEAGPSSSKKQRGKPTNAKSKGKQKALHISADDWPEYFKDVSTWCISGHPSFANSAL